MRNRVVSVHQPNFMPWLKLLDKILASDVYVAYDTVQFTRSEYHARQRIRRGAGAMWLTVPVHRIPGRRQTLREVRIDNSQAFRARHLEAVRCAYEHSPYFAELYPRLERVYRGEQETLVEFNLEIISTLCAYLGSTVRIVRASALPHAGTNAERLVALTRAAGGDRHLTSTYGPERSFVDWPAVSDAGITILSQRFAHPVYEQPHGPFLPDLSAVDMLFGHGRDTASLLAGRRDALEVPPLRETPTGAAPDVACCARGSVGL